MLIKLAAMLLVAYLAGSVNFSILLFKILGKGDPRSQFSGNPGATNVYRQAGKIWAAVVLLLDMGRAIMIAVLAVRLLPANVVTLPGLALIIGNRFPCFHGFQGGKGVANYLGFTVLLAPVATAVSALAWLFTFLLFRKPFLASFAMVLVLGAGTMWAFRGLPAAMAVTGLTMLMIFFNHKQNVAEWIGTPKK